MFVLILIAELYDSESLIRKGICCYLLLSDYIDACLMYYHVLYVLRTAQVIAFIKFCVGSQMVIPFAMANFSNRYRCGAQ